MAWIRLMEGIAMDEMTDYDLVCIAVWLWVVTPITLWLVAQFHP
jgi:hypothetical protein